MGKRDEEIKLIFNTVKTKNFISFVRRLIKFKINIYSHYDKFLSKDSSVMLYKI